MGRKEELNAHGRGKHRFVTTEELSAHVAELLGWAENSPVIRGYSVTWAPSQRVTTTCLGFCLGWIKHTRGSASALAPG